MPFLTLGQASRETGVHKSTIARAVDDGRLSATKNEHGHYQIDPSELFRVFDPVGQDPLSDTVRPLAQHHETPVAMSETNETLQWFQEQIDELQKENADKDKRLAELRKAMSVLPSPDQVQATIDKMKRKLAKEIHAEREKSKQQETQWTKALAERQAEITVARSEAEALREREQEQAVALKHERERVAALESRGFIARLLNKKPTTAG